MLSSQAEVEKLLSAIRARAPHAEVARLTDQLSLLCRAQFAPVPDSGWTDLGLTKLEGRLMRALAERVDRVLDRGALMDALYFDSGGEEPDPKIVDILVCKLRKKIAASGWRIETVWGQGYRARHAPEIVEQATARALAMLAA